MIVAALVGLAFFLITHPIHGRPQLGPNLMSYSSGPAEILLRIAGFTGLPSLATAWYRRRGRRGGITGEQKCATGHGRRAEGKQKDSERNSADTVDSHNLIATGWFRPTGNLCVRRIAPRAEHVVSHRFRAAYWTYDGLPV
jgi:hypothetical protein